MDFDIENDVIWNWQELDRSLAEEPRYDISPWVEETTVQEEMTCMLNEATPVKACLDVQWRVSESDDLMKEKQSAESRVSAKRRRVLQFNDEPIDFPLCTEELSSDYLKTKVVEESMDNLLPEISPWDGTSSDFVPGINFGMTDADKWLAEFLSDTDINSEDMNLSAASDIHFSLSDCCGIQPIHKAASVEHFVPPPPTPEPKPLSGKVIFKGRTSYIKTSIKPASCVAYPFTFIKPCPEKGGITLQDINRIIHSPPPRKTLPPKPLKSAISGKLVAGKTRIRTEGGKGSITITRTRG